MKYEQAQDVIPSLQRAGIKFGEERINDNGDTRPTATVYGQVGIGILGKLDYLRRKHNYRIYRNG